MPTWSHAGTVFRYEDTHPGGKGDPALILGHGFFMDRRMWEPLGHLLDNHRIITWDARGHGETYSTGGDEDFSYWDQARDMLGLLDHLGIDQAVLGGLSQGGYIALRAALLEPRRCAGLVLLSTEARPSSPQTLAQYRELFAAWPSLPDDQWRGLARQLATGALLGDSDPELIELWIDRWAARRGGIGPAARCLLGRDDITGMLDRLAMPALVARADDDDAISAESFAELRDGLAGPVAAEVLDDGAHTFALTRPRETARAIARLLQSLR